MPCYTLVFCRWVLEHYFRFFLLNSVNGMKKKNYNQRVKYRTVESNHLFGALNTLGRVTFAISSDLSRGDLFGRCRARHITLVTSHVPSSQVSCLNS